MRAKTLGIFLLIGFALFTAVYWITDTTRRDAAFETQQEELLAYGHELFGPPTPEIAVTATGTSSTACSTFCAVTITSSITVCAATAKGINTTAVPTTQNFVDHAEGQTHPDPSRRYDAPVSRP